MSARKPVLPVLSALLVDLVNLANGAKPHPKASREGDLRVLGIARDELTAAEAVIRMARRAGPYVSMADDVAMGRAIARLDRATGRDRR